MFALGRPVSGLYSECEWPSSGIYDLEREYFRKSPHWAVYLDIHRDLRSTVSVLPRGERSIWLLRTFNHYTRTGHIAESSAMLSKEREI